MTPGQATDRSTAHATTVAGDAPRAVRANASVDGAAAMAPVATHNVSIVMPVRNEAEQIAASLERLRDCGAHEVIVVDGESSDDTATLARLHGAIVVTSAPGRGVQMNAGAQVAQSDVLIFLHADTRLVPDFVTRLQSCLAAPGVVAGAFALQIDAPQWSYRVIEAIARLRARWFQFPYGDQALFMTAKTFARVGGYPEWPIMEDFELVRRLRRIGRIASLDSVACTSARRWQQHGVWRTTLLNQLCVAAYWLGVSPSRIARWRR